LACVKYQRATEVQKNSVRMPIDGEEPRSLIIQALWTDQVRVHAMKGLMSTKILIADDSSVSRCLLRGLLEKWKYEVIEVEDGVAALKELQSANAPRLAIIDWMMPGLNGPEVVKELRTTQHELYTYVLLLTAKGEKSDLLCGLDAGVDDYLTKPFDINELRARLRVGERIINLQERLLRALNASEFRASHDALTGLYNRGAVIRLLQREAARCSREAAPLGVILVDVDHFKHINDKYGHCIGDEVLLEVAGRMRATVRSYDFLGRYGGEEFLIVAPGCGTHATENLAERVRRAVADQAVCIGQLEVPVTISLGATLAQGAEDCVRYLQQADAALYRAKNNGRNKVVCDFDSVSEDDNTIFGGASLPHIAALSEPRPDSQIH
jgi:two-component system cell cycle response regulator